MPKHSVKLPGNTISRVRIGSKSFLHKPSATRKLKIHKPHLRFNTSRVDNPVDGLEKLSEFASDLADYLIMKGHSDLYNFLIMQIMEVNDTLYTKLQLFNDMLKAQKIWEREERARKINSNNNNNDNIGDLLSAMSTLGIN
jgi:hypothetical protein